jgi:hypothetical protein
MRGSTKARQGGESHAGEGVHDVQELAHEAIVIRLEKYPGGPGEAINPS